MNNFDITAHPDFSDHETVKVISTDQLSAIIAVHNSTLGPAVGGCRMFPYVSQDDALKDVLRLSRGMTYKSALAGLPLGGGKSVIIGDPSKDKSRDLLLAMGEQIEKLGGRYITAEDSGTGVEDMAIMSETTSYVSGFRAEENFGGDPSPKTALGVFLGIQEAVQFRFQSDLSGLRVLVQGAGHVGLHLIGMLIEAGAKVTATDLNQNNLEQAKALGAQIIAPDALFSEHVDVFAPCAMGGVVSEDTAAVIKADIIAGAANNQLASDVVDQQLKDRGILYVPDYVINAGGIIDVFYQRAGERSETVVTEHIERIRTTLDKIFAVSVQSGQGTGRVADEMAEAVFRKDLSAVA